MIETLIDKLIDCNVQVELVDGDKLKVHTGVTKIPDDLLAELKLRKQELVNYLRDQQANDFEEIAIVPPADDYILSPAQRSIWLVSQFEEANIAYNMPGAFVFEGELDHDALAFAFDVLIERHEMLRTVFKEGTKGEVRQFINPTKDSRFSIGYRDLRQETEQDDLVKKIIKEEFTRPFNLLSGPLMRADLCRQTDDKWLFILVLHHIISDGWSMDIMLNELLTIYNARTMGEMHSFKPLRIQYKDYANWQQNQLNGNAIIEHKEYWLKQFEGSLPVLELYADKERPAIKTYNGSKWSKPISLELTNELKKLSHDNGTTLFMGLMAWVNALLHRYTSQEDIIIGTPIASRQHADTLDQVGYYINTLALRNRFNGNDSYLQLLSTTKQVVLDAYMHQVYPFEELVTALNLQRDISRNPLFDVQVVLQNSAASDKRKEKYFHKLRVSEFEEAVYSTSVFYMVFSFTETVEGLRADIMYNCDIYSEGAIERLADHLESMLAAIVKEPGKPINRLSFLDAQDTNKLLKEFNDTAVEYTDKTIVELFREQASRIPGNTAAVFADRRLTYKELDEKSDQLAAYLVKNYNARPGALIGMLLGRSEKMLITILGIVKSGAAYVPIDPEYPNSRKEFIVKDAGIKLLITQTDYMFDLAFYDADLFAIDVQWNDLDAPGHVDTNIHAGDLAYVIYTSGSTGEPKGVMVEHGALANSIQAQQEIFSLNEADKCLQFFSLSFDVSVFEIFISLVSGAVLYIVSDDDKKNPLMLERYIRDNAIDIATLPAVYLQLIETKNLPALKKLITGGEPVPAVKALPFTEQGIYYNAYGPTESAICVSVFKLDKTTNPGERNVPIGKPIPNTQLYIVDEHENLVPVGVTGEIYIGGAGLARGYLNNPALTAEKFVPDPFNKGKKLYRTGDIGRWQADGNIEFIGRKDDQLKIRGYRIELGEIQFALQSHPDIDSCAVVAEPGKDGEKELIAYVTGRQTFTAAGIRAYLSNIIPAYMLPNHYVQLSALPLTTNGKVDRQKLPAAQGSEMPAGIEYTGPRTETEIKMVSIWQELLGKDKVGIRDDYFELGGSSLKAMGIIKKMIDEIGVSIPIKVLFEEKTIENIAKYIAAGGAMDIETYASVPVAGDQVTAASYNQLIYFSDRNRNDIVRGSYEVEYIDVDTFKLAVQQLIERHETLRTIFEETGGTVRQRVLQPGEFNFEVKGPVPVASEEEMNRLSENEQFRTFDLHKFPLLFVEVYKVDGGNYHILFTIHHIATDGYSAGVLLRDLDRWYTANLEIPKGTLTPLPFQYRHFTAWQQNFLASPQGERHKRYWLKRLENFNQALNICSQGEVPQHNADASICVTKTIGGKLREDIELFCIGKGLTRTSLLMAVLNLLINQVSGEDDITITSTVSSRNSKYYGELDVSRVVGFFANSLFLRNTIDREKTIGDYLQGVQRNFLEDLDYQDYPFGKLIGELPGFSPGQFLSKAVFFNYHNYEFKQLVEHEIVEEAAGETGVSAPVQAGFGLAVTEYKNCLQLQLIFNPHLFRSARALEIASLYFSILSHAINKPELPISQLSGQWSVLNETIPSVV